MENVDGEVYRVKIMSLSAPFIALVLSNTWTIDGEACNGRIDLDWTCV